MSCCETSISCHSKRFKVKNKNKKNCVRAKKAWKNEPISWNKIFNFSVRKKRKDSIVRN